MIIMPQCGFCAHKPPRGKGVHPVSGWPTCTAFPEGILREIIFEGDDHRVPFPGDHGILFKPKNKQAAKDVEALYDTEYPEDDEDEEDDFEDE